MGKAVPRPRQCRICLFWGSLTHPDCEACRHWRRSHPDGVCGRCQKGSWVNRDGLCRSCLMGLRNDEPSPSPRPAARPSVQLQLILAAARGRKAMPLPIRQGDEREPLRDNPRLLPPVSRGQLTFFTMPRRISLDYADQLAARRWDDWDDVTGLVADVARERGVGDAWRRMIFRRLRIALAIRDADGHGRMPEEVLDDIPGSGVEGLAEVLGRAEMLQPRRRPRKGRWPIRSCEHCNCWGITAARCPSCRDWENQPTRYMRGRCRRCQRGSLPLSNGGLCRGCMIHIREHGRSELTSSDTQLQFALDGRPAFQLRSLSGRLGYRPDGHPMRARERERARRRRPKPSVSDHLVDPAQLELFTSPRDWARVGRLLAADLPALTPAAAALLDKYTEVSRQQARLRAPDPHLHRSSLRALRIMVSWLGAEAPFNERDIRQLAMLDGNITGQRVLWFLAERGLLIPDPEVDHDERRIEARLQELPDRIADELRCWVRVMRGEGRYKHPAVGFNRIRRRLRALDLVLDQWANQVISLREITEADCRAALEDRSAGRARYLHNALRGLFQALKQERAIFRDPMRGISLPAQVRLPASLPSDQLHGILDRAGDPLAKLVVALVAVHALYPGVAARIRMADVDLAEGRIILRQGWGQHRSLFLDPLTMDLVSEWLRERQQSWPTSQNPHLLVTSQTALDPNQPTVGKTFLQKIFSRAGATARKLRQDRILHEARLTSDPVHLMRLFGISDTTAVKYVSAAHPEKTGRGIR
ncbi:hypothetical protein [Streptomyces sp. NPDC006333]|uniref:site-specific integrase n=1 Tax=Streptomyces sp. NPDC006333 TaxID=3156753 RepID=UPI0033B245FD